MFGENAERRRLAPISSATEWYRFLKISSRVGSNFIFASPCVFIGPPASKLDCPTNPQRRAIREEQPSSRYIPKQLPARQIFDPARAARDRKRASCKRVH